MLAGARHRAAAPSPSTLLWRNVLLARVITGITPSLHTRPGSHPTSSSILRPSAATIPSSLLLSSGVRAASTCSSLPDSIVQEQEIVLLERVFGKEYQTLTKPLKHGRKIQTHFGSLDESDIIGKACLDTVASSSGQAVRIHAPTLAEYVTLTPRQVTPVYPDDANLIVSLLDLHVATPGPRADGLEPAPRLEILEAGTGHGSLTLHLARAIHAANAPRPPTSTAGGEADDLSAWKARRAAVVHTVDRSARYSAAAQNVVSGFRRGLYAGNVDFHVGDVTQFIETRARSGGRQVFSHVLLDLPDVQTHLDAAAGSLRDGGLLLVFCPSVTQIAKCVTTIRERGLPLSYNQVLELGSGLSGGKQWDVRAAKIRNPGNELSSRQHDAASQGTLWGRVRSLIARLVGVNLVDANPPERWEMVCRPSVGHRVVGGGFVGVWQRKRLSIGDQQSDSPTGGSSKETSA